MVQQNVGVFLCQGGGSRAESPEFRQLRWWAEAGFPQGKVFEITQACQQEGTQSIARLCSEHGVSNVVLGACPMSRGRADLFEVMRAQGGALDSYRELDTCMRPDGGPMVCQVAPNACQALNLAAAELEAGRTGQVSQTPVSSRVLIIGAGLAALWAADSLARAGHGVVLITLASRLTLPEPLYGTEAVEQSQKLKEDLKANPAVEIIKGGELISLSGPAGDFEAVILDLEGTRRRLQAGAVLLTQGPPQALNLDIDQAPGVLDLDQLLALLDAPAHFKKRFKKKPLHVGLGLGLKRQSAPPHLAGAFRAALQLLEEHGAKVSIFTNYAKVAQPELEQLSQKAMDSGALMFKCTAQPPNFTISGDAISAEVLDAIAGIPLKLELDILALDTRPRPDQKWQTLVKRLGLTPNPQGYINGLSPGLSPGQTPKGGVLALGPAAGPASLDQLADQIGHAAMFLEGLLSDKAPEAAPAQVMVDRKKCALCLTCVRVCPSGAMGRNQRLPQYNPLVCTGCGTCAAECPMDAIELLNLEDRRMNKMIKAGLKSPEAWAAPDDRPEVLVLACTNSAMRSLQKARAQKGAWPEGVRLVEVPCAGKIDPDMVMRALREGYDLVQVIACHPGACYSLEGNTWAGLREGYLRRMLDDAGLGDARLLWASAAPNMAGQAIELVREAVRRAEELGLSPLKAAAKARDLLSKFTLKMDDAFTIIP